MEPRGDTPRRIVVCWSGDYPRVQRAVTRDLGLTDVLVRPNPFIEPGTTYVIDPSVGAVHAAEVWPPWRNAEEVGL